MELYLQIMNFRGILSLFLNVAIKIYSHYLKVQESANLTLKQKKCERKEAIIYFDTREYIYSETYLNCHIIM